MTAISLNLPRPHPKQHAIKHDKAKRKVICAGRRAGKTTLMAMMAIEDALRGRRVLYATPTQDQSEQFWVKCKGWIAPLLNRGVVVKNETRHSLSFWNKGHIKAKTAWDADTLRGDYADRLMLDEYPLMKASAWDLVGAPMLLDNDGDALFIGTPKRKNHFFHLYVRGLQDGKRWRSWQFTSHDNPYLSRAALAEITQDLTESAYKQEILAQFLENEGTVFRNIAACMNADDSTPKEHRGHKLVAGVDWGRQNDFTAISIVCADCAQEVARDRFNKIDYHFQRGRLAAWAKRWKVGDMLVEENSIGRPNFEELFYEGLPVRAFQMTSASKPPLIQNLALALEKEEIQWQADPIWMAELESYERKISSNTGRESYSAPEGVHDDTVIARALALKAMQEQGSYFIEL